MEINITFFIAKLIKGVLFFIEFVLNGNLLLYDNNIVILDLVSSPAASSCTKCK